MRTDNAQESVRQKREGDVSMPCPPLPTLVFVESTVAFGFLESHLDTPPHPGNADHLLERGLAWSEHDIVGALAWVLDVAANQEPVTPLPFFLGDLQTPQPLPLPVIQPWTFRSGTSGKPTPSLRGK
jgi:hypothetical protein